VFVCSHRLTRTDVQAGHGPDQGRHRLRRPEAERRLPSVRELSEALNVSAITIKRAYQDLETRASSSPAPAWVVRRPVERDALRERKLAELQGVRRLVRSSAKFGISADDIVRLARQRRGTDMDTVLEATELTKHTRTSASGVSASRVRRGSIAGIFGRNALARPRC